MKQHDARAYLHDILQASDFVRELTAEKTLEDYEADPILRKAAERDLITLGEALTQAVRADPKLSARITQAGLVISFRNRLVHGYATIANEIVWAIIQTDLPLLRAEVAALLAEMEAEGSSAKGPEPHKR